MVESGRRPIKKVIAQTKTYAYPIDSAWSNKTVFSRIVERPVAN